MNTIKLSNYGVTITDANIGQVNEQVTVHPIDEPLTLDFEGIRGIDSKVANELLASLRSRQGGQVFIKNTEPMVRSVLIFSGNPDPMGVASSTATRKRATRRLALFSRLFSLLCLFALSFGFSSQAWAWALRIPGDWDWSTTGDYVSDNNNTAEFYRNINAGSYAFKVYIDWGGTNQKWYSLNNKEMTDGCTYFQIYENNGNMTFNSTYNAKYKFGVKDDNGIKMWVEKILPYTQIVTTGSNSAYLGDKLGEWNVYWAIYDVGTWTSSKVRIGTSNTSYSEYTSNADGTYGNGIKVKANLSGFQFKTTGTYKVFGVLDYCNTKYCTNGSNSTQNTSTSIAFTNSPLTWTVSAIPAPTNFTATAQSSSSIKLSWNLNTANHYVIIIQDEDDVPTNGTNYNTGDSFGAGKVVYIGNSTSKTIFDLEPGTSHTYYIYSVNNGYYSTGTNKSAQTYYTVTYKPGINGTGSESVAEKIPSQSLTLKGITFTRTGFMQDGWATSDGGAKAYDLGALYTTDANIILYPTWHVQTYVVTFDVHESGHGSLGAKVGETSINSGDAIDASSKIVFTATPNTGYHVAGWYSDAACSQAITGAGTETSYTIASLAKAETVYVKFEQTDYTINFVVYPAAGGSIIQPATTPKTDAHYQVPFDIEAQENTGYHFVSWTSTDDITLGVKDLIYAMAPARKLANNVELQTSSSQASTNAALVAVDGGKTITANFAANTYKVHFNTNTGEGEMADEDFTYNVSKALTTNIFTKTGYDFKGWDIDPAGETIVYTNGQTVSNLSSVDGATVQLYAVWAPHVYNITYKDKGNTTYSGNNIGSLPTTHTYDTQTNLVPGTKTGYEFQGWYKEQDCSGTAVTTIGAKEITVNLTLYAKWQINRYTLNLPDTTTDGGTKVCNFKIDSVKPAPVDGKYDYNTHIQVYLSPKDGYRLDVTATYNDGSEKSLPLTHNDFSFLYTFNMPTGDVTISVDPKEYKLEGNFSNGGGTEVFDGTKHTFDGVTHSFTLSLEGGKSYKFKVYNEAYSGTSTYGSDHFMGFNDDKNIQSTTAGYEVACDGASCFVLHAGIGGDYTFSIGTSENNKPLMNVQYPDVSYIEYDGHQYGFTQYGQTDKFIITDGIPFPNTNTEYKDMTFVWKGTRYEAQNIMNGDESAHTNIKYYIWTSNSVGKGVSIHTAAQAKAGDNYYFIWDPNNEQLTAVYPSYIAGSWTNWAFTQPLSFDGDIATYTHQFTAEEKAKDGGIQFKIVYEGKWYSVNTDQTFTQTGSKTLSQDDKHPNMTLTPNALDDEYTFTFNKSTKQLTVYYPEANKYKVQVSENGTDFVEKEIGSTSGIMIHADSKSGYRFTGWETTGDIVLDKNAQTTNVKANSAGTVKATYSNDGFVYFRDPYKDAWGKAHAYFYSGPYWDDKKGSGSKNIQHGPYGMAKVEGSDDNNPIYYFDYKSNFQDWPANIIAFTNNYCQGSDNFNMVQAAYRGDFNSSLPMYVPRNFKTHYLNSSEYYNEGIWMKFNDKESGYDLRGGFNNWVSYANKFVASEASPNNFDFYTTVYLEAEKTYQFLIYNENGTQYGCPYQTIKTKTDGEHGWKFYETQGNCQIKANVSGDYRFHINLQSGEVILYVTYPMEAGDYRVHYGTGDAIRYSNVIKSGNPSGLISLWLPNGTTTLNFEKVTSIAGDGTITWDSEKTIDVTTTAAGVYQMTLTSAGTISDDLTAYKGDFFIRTDCADGGWDNYLTNPDNKMVNNEQQPEYSANPTQGYNYYFMKFNRAENGNVRFAVANTINGNLSGIMKGDDIIGNDKETLPGQQANIRFSWNSNTNTLNRAYMSGSTDIAARFLVLQADDRVFDKNGKELTIAGGGKIEGLNEHELNFADNGNWVYQADIQAQPTARGRLIATYKNYIQYFLGAEGETLTDANTVQILGGSSDNTDKYLLRAVYDFKTNQLITAWLPVSGDMPIGKVTPINADMMLIREGQETPQAITFENSGKLTDIKSIYGVIELKKAKMTHANMQGTWSANNGYSYQYCNYYISFPFDVKISEITGIGTYGSVWQIQKYDGALRASIGWFAETKTFWTTMAVTDKLEKNVGYLLQLDRSTFKDKSNNIWANIPNDGSVYIYFPSESETIGTIQSGDTTTTVPSHPCGINQTFKQDEDKPEPERRNHMQTDSHWNMIGAPLFNTATENEMALTEVVDDDFRFFYNWDYTTNSMVIMEAQNYQFLPMHGYMVQYAGNITWTGSAIITPASIAARRLGDDNKNYKVDLQILNNKEERVSRTYVELAEGANDDFQLNEDVYMMANSVAASIYSFAGSYDVAANVLSVKNHEIPLGIEVKTAGTYTFHMPSQFDGLAVLVDHAANVETILNADDYEIYLDKGTCEGRFSLKLDVERKIGTDLHGADYQGRKDVFKYIDNNHMYILRDGRLYNANGIEMSK